MIPAIGSVAARRSVLSAAVLLCSESSQVAAHAASPAASSALLLLLPIHRRHIHSSRKLSQQDSGAGPSRKPFARVVNTKSSKAAFEQRQILDELRGPSSASGDSSLAQAQEQPRFNATAEAALNAASGGQGGAMPLGVAGLSVGSGAGYGNGGVIDRWTGGAKKWKDLKGGEKVARATVQSSRTLFIAGGAALTFVLVYALSSELFAKNSPTVVFGDACKRVQKSAAVAEHLLPPYRFHTSSAFTTSTSSPSPLNPPARGRRSRSVASYSYIDEKTGQEKMLLRFFVEARDKDKDLTLWDETRYHIVEAGKWAGLKIQEGGEWASEQLGLFQDEQDDGSRSSTAAIGGEPEAKEASEPSLIGSALSSAWNYSFGGLTGLARGGGDALGKLTASKREPGTWSSGEVHAEMEKDENGVLQYKRFFIDIPSSTATVRERVWIVKKKGDVER